ncbi:MAG: penicillin-binding transpeptidase domain-containing protein [Parcubacteria group bacterium]
MYRRITRHLRRGLGFFRQSGKRYEDINPEDIFLDSANLPGFEEHTLEGRIEKPVSKETFFFMKVVIALVVFGLLAKLWVLGVMQGPVYAQISENNRLEQTLIFANRGVIYDRNMLELAGNAIREDQSAFAERMYPQISGLSHVVGYVKYPLSDKAGNYYEENYRGRDGVESIYNEILSGKNGLKLKETNVYGGVTSESVIEGPQDGEPLVLAIDAHLTEVLHQSIASLSRNNGFVGGAGVIMDVETGEILAMTSFPEYDQNMLTKGRETGIINSLLESPSKPFLNRVIGGLYTPGSILKPIIALGALNEAIISPQKKIMSTGSITVPNPYDPSKPSVFGDWKAHGLTNMREALAVSSDVYFYSIGGGYEDQKGLGITKLEQYFRQFRITEKTGIDLNGEVEGVIPNPEWKKEKFDNDIWRLGDTYITSIGQYGTLMTPLNAVRMTSAIANGGKLLHPSLVSGGHEEPIESRLSFAVEDFKIVQDGMRDAVRYGTAIGLNVPYVNAAAKTGTAEIGAGKLYVHSWSVGYFPFDNPRYAWAVIMERGPSQNTLGATSVMRNVFDWINVNRPEYFD